MILVINAGSSNVKFALYDPDSLQAVYKNKVANIQDVFAWLKSSIYEKKIITAGHRIVHGGKNFFQPTIIDKNILTQLKILIPLAPLHQPHNIAAIETYMLQYPHVTQIGCFDTAFHHNQPELAKLFAIPRDLIVQGVIKYGFHGLSYEYIASVMPEKIGSAAQGKVIVAHLGNGASMCAMQNCQSVATTMGFSALEGLMMGTRCGSIDPGVLLYLLQEQNYSLKQLTDLLYDKSGLLGVSNLSNDMRILLASDKSTARTAIDLFCYKAATAIGSLIVALQGCDAIVFTAGIGENVPEIRRKICTWLAWLGVKVDSVKNSSNATLINNQYSKVLLAVIPTDEELVIAKHARSIGTCT